MIRQQMIRHRLSSGLTTPHLSRRVTLTHMTMAAVPVTTQAMRSLHYSEQAWVLAERAQEKGYKSNLWVSKEDDAWWIKDSTHVKPEEINNYVETFLPKRIQLYNGDQVQGFNPEPADKHSSYTTKKSYGKRFADKLEKQARERGHKSKWWMPWTAIKNNGLDKFKGEIPYNLQFNFQQRVYNADQYESPEAITLVPINGSTCLRIHPKNVSHGRDVFQDLVSFMQEKQFDNGLFYSKSDLALRNLQVKPDAKPYNAPTHFSQLYNVEQLTPESLNTLSSSLSVDPTSETKEHLNAVTGRPLPTVIQNVLASADNATKFSSKLWVTERDMALGGFQLNASEDPMVPSIAMYNVAQLVSPSEGFKLAGRGGIESQEK